MDRFTNELLNPTTKTGRSPDSPLSPKRKSDPEQINTTSNFEVVRCGDKPDSQAAAGEGKEAAAAKSSHGDSEETKQASTATKVGKNFKQVMQAAYKENQLHNVVRFMTDYLRQVIENGSRFNSGHFFIMLLQLSASEVKN